MFTLQALTALLLAAVPLVAGEDSQYIVTLKKGIARRDVDSHIEWVNDVHKRSIVARDLGLDGFDERFDIGNFHSYSGTFDDATLEEIRKSPNVAHVEEVREVFYAAETVTQENAGWALGSISNRERGPFTYQYHDSAGEGTYAYVLDSGVLETHPELEGRIIKGVVTNGRNHFDVEDHGTPVAGVIVSKSLGVAKKAMVVDVKITDVNYPTQTQMLRALNWTAGDIMSKGRLGRAVINISAGSDEVVPSIDEAVEAMFDQGILCIVAAGNENRDGDGSSPGRVSNVLTVGAVNFEWNRWRGSNFGPGVDIFAPGENVRVTSRMRGEPFKLASGTSFATPHITGIALLLMSAENITQPQKLTDRILELATLDKITGLPEGTPNRMAYNGHDSHREPA